MTIYLSGPVTKIKAQEFDWVSLKVSTTYRTMLAKQDFHFSAIYVYLLPLTNILDLLIIPKLLQHSTSWQDMFSHYRESFTPAFCAEVPEAESVN